MLRQDKQFRITKFKGKAIAVAVGALFSAVAPQAVFAVAVPDATTTAITGAQTVEFTGTNGTLTGIATVADGLTIGAVTVTPASAGTLTFTGAATSVAIGGAANVVGLVNFNGVAGKTVTSNALFATNVSMGAGTYTPSADVTAAINFTADGTINLAANQKIVGSVTNTTAGQGTLTFGIPTGQVTLVSGNVGSTGTGLKAVNVDSGNGQTVTFGGTITALKINLNNDGVTNLNGDVTGAVNLVTTNGDGRAVVAADKKIVGTVTTATTNKGVLQFRTSTAASTTLVSGAVGAAGLLLKDVFTDNGGKSNAFGGAIFATGVELSGAGTTTVAGDITATTVTINNGGTLSMAANQKIVGAVTSDDAGAGTLTFAANTAATTLVSGAVGSTNFFFKAVNVAPAAGITATFGGAVTASTVTTTGTGTVQFNGTVTAATAVNFGADGTISMGADALIAGAVTNTTAGQGTLTFAAPTANRTLVSGATGSTGTGLKAVNIATGNGFTSTMTGAVKAGTVTVTGTGTATFTGGVTGNINIGSAATVTAAAAITGNVDNTTTTGTGTLTLGATIGVTGNIGATNALNTVTSNSTGGTTAFGGTVRATTITLGGTGTATFADTVTGAVNFTADGTATVAAGKNIVGAVTNTTANNGTLTFAGGTTTGGAIGSTGTGLLAANFNGGTVSIGHDIKAATTTFANASTSTFTSARTLTGNVVVSGTATVDTGAFNTAVTGTMSTGATTTLKTALTSATVAGQFNVGGNATVVAGTKVYVNVGAFAVADGAKIKVVNGTGGVNVVNLTTGNVTTNSAVLSFSGQAGNDTGTLAATGEDLYVVATRAAGGFTAVSGIASTAPGGAAGAVLNAIAVAVPTVGSDMATVVNTFNGYTAAQLQTELPKLAPLTGAAAVSAGMGSVSQALNLVNTRMASSRGDSSILSADVAGSGVSAGTTAGREFWLKGFGNNSAQGAVDGFSGYGGTTYGVAGGVDTGIGGDMRVGVSLGYAKARIGNNNDGNAGAGGRVNVDTYQISLYGSREFGQGYIDGMVGYAWHRTDNSRLAALGRTATGATNADQWTARIGGGYRIAMGGKTVFTPLASLEFSNFRQKAYTESGAGALSLNVDGVSASRIKGGVGARISGEGTMASGTVYRPEVHVGVYNDFRNAGVDSSASFTGGGTSFVTTGARLQRTSFNVGAGVTFLQGKTGSVGLVYDYEGRSSYKAHNVSLQGRWSF